MIIYTGYGNLDEVPALYGLWWNSASLIEKASGIKRNLQGKENVFVLKNGFYSLWQNIVEKDGVNIKYECDIKSINRYLNDKHHSIEIKYRNGKNEFDEIFECD